MKLFKLWFPVFLWGALIFYLSSLPDLTTGLGLWDFILRKIAHILEYFILTLLLYRAFKASPNLSNFQLFIWPFTLSSLYAVSDELHQLFVPGRSCQFWDVLIDTSGIIVFYALIKLNQGFSKKIMLWT